MNEQILASGKDSCTFDDGAARTEHRVTADGVVQSGTACLDRASRTWQSPGAWEDWRNDEIVRASKSPNGDSAQQWFCRLPAEVRQVIRVHYGLVVASHPCGAGCGRKVVKAGDLCQTCLHDA